MELEILAFWFIVILIFVFVVKLVYFWMVEYFEVVRKLDLEFN